MLSPRFKITFWQAFRARFERNYFPILVTLYLSWWVKVWVHPTPASNWVEFERNLVEGFAIPWWIPMLATTSVPVLLASVLLFVSQRPDAQPESAYWPDGESECRQRSRVDLLDT